MAARARPRGARRGGAGGGAHRRGRSYDARCAGSGAPSGARCRRDSDARGSGLRERTRRRDGWPRDLGWVPREFLARRAGCSALTALTRGDRRGGVARGAERGVHAPRRSDRNGDTDALDGRLLSDLRDGAEHVRRQLAVDRVDPQAGVGVLDRAHHLPRAELRRLLWGADAVQRDQWSGQYLGPRERLLPLRQAPGRTTTT